MPACQRSAFRCPVRPTPILEVQFIQEVLPQTCPELVEQVGEASGRLLSPAQLHARATASPGRATPPLPAPRAWVFPGPPMSSLSQGRPPLGKAPLPQGSCRGLRAEGDLAVPDPGGSVTVNSRWRAQRGRATWRSRCGGGPGEERVRGGLSATTDAPNPSFP